MFAPMMQLSYVWSRIVLLVAVIGFIAMISAAVAETNAPIHCKAMFMRSCKAECAYFPVRAEYDIFPDRIVTTTKADKPVAALGIPENKSNLRWNHRRWKTKMNTLWATLDVASDLQSEYPSFFSLVVTEPSVEISGFCQETKAPN